MNFQTIIPMFCGCVLAGSIAQAETGSLAPVPPPNVKVLQIQSLQMDLMRWEGDLFYENLTELIQALSAGFSTGRLFILLDFAELYLSQMMLHEARFVVEDIEASKPPDYLKRRLRQVTDSIAILEGDGLEEAENSPLFDPARRDRQFWIALNAIALGNSLSLVENIEGAFNSQEFIPREIIRSVLPALVETMIETGKYTFAERAIAVLESFQEYRTSSTVYFFLGQLAQKQGKEKSALDFFLLSANGWDRYAARARLKLADAALASGRTEAFIAAQEILEFGASAWRGDRFELMTLERLARVDRLAQQPYKTLLTNNKIILRFPGSDEAEEALRASERDIRMLYESGVKGEISISDWLEMHLRLVPIYRNLPVFSEVTELFADKILEFGATGFAIAEYDRSLDLLDILQKSSGKPIPPNRTASLQLKKVRAFIQSGRYEDAKNTLPQIKVSGDEALAILKQELTSQVFSALGDSGAVLRGPERSLSENYLRQRAFAYWKIGRWGESSLLYMRLWSEYFEEFNVEDASYLLISARRSGDTQTAQSVAEAFPELTDSAWSATMAERLLVPPADISSLSLGGAEGRIFSAEKTLKELSKNGL